MTGIDPLRMRTAVADYVGQIHRSYLSQARTFPPAVRGRLALLAGERVQVAAVAARNLHVLATRESLGPLREPEVELAGEMPGLRWTVRFFDPVVTPELGLLDERDGPAFGEIRHVLGIGTVVYHLTAEPGTGLTAHNAMHVGTGLANGHAAADRDFESIRHRARGREELVDELAGASVAGLRRAQALLASAIAPRDAELATLAADPAPDPDRVRRTLLAALGGGVQR
jgi:hypothetical protein